MPTTPFDPADLTAERNLYDIYRQWRLVERPRFNFRVSICVLIVLSAYAITDRGPRSSFANQVIHLADKGFDFTGAILGFLVAGFAIFATITDKYLFARMAMRNKEGTALSYLKYIFFAFMDVFTLYLTYAVVCWSVLLTCQPGGMVDFMLSGWGETGRSFRIVGPRVAFVVLGTYSIYLLLALKSFIFNMYHVVMATIRWQIESGPAARNKHQDQ